MRKRKLFNKYKDAKHPAIKSVCRAAKAEDRKARNNFEEKLAHNIKMDKKPFFAYVRRT